MSKWNRIEKSKIVRKRLFEVEGCSEEPIDVYKSRYSVEPSSLSEQQTKDVVTHVAEVFSYFEEGSSVLIFGSGHSLRPNKFSYFCDNIVSITAWDMISESGMWLSPDINFINVDILAKDVDEHVCEKHDYVFSSHTFEHFTRDQLFDKVFPTLVKLTKKSLVVAVPYLDSWGKSPSHKCRFSLDDEFAYLATKYKFSRAGEEIIYWFNKEDLNEYC